MSLILIITSCYQVATKEEDKVELLTFCINNEDSPWTTRSRDPLPSSVSIWWVRVSILEYTHQYGPVSSEVKFVMMMSKLGNVPFSSNLPPKLAAMVGCVFSMSLTKICSLLRPPSTVSNSLESLDLQWMVTVPPNSRQTTPWPST